MHVIDLLAGQTKELPWLAHLSWDITGQSAVADLERLAGLRQRFDPDTKKTTLIVRPAPETLPIMSALHAAGWKLGNEPTNVPMWRLTAIHAADGVALAVKGYQSTLPDGTEYHAAAPHAATSYWSPPPPEMRGRGWKARSKEWNDRLLTGDWGDWTHTPRPEVPWHPAITMEESQ